MRQMQLDLRDTTMRYPPFFFPGGSILSDDAEPFSRLLNMQVNIYTEACSEKNKQIVFFKTVL